MKPRGIGARFTLEVLVGYRKAFLVVFLAACGQGESPLGIARSNLAGSNMLSVESGDGQWADAGDTAAHPLVVRLKDAGGAPVANALITWSVRSNGGEITAATARTDSTGRARATAVLGFDPGSNRYVATDSTADSAVLRLTGRDKLLSSAMGYTSCGVATTDETFCWGKRPGQFNVNVPVSVNAPVVLDEITRGENYQICGLAHHGQAYCWGGNERGVLGTGQPLNTIDSVPLEVATNLRFISLGAGLFHTCGVTTAGDAYCWGGHDKGVLGSAGGDVAVPRRVTSPQRFMRISAAHYTTCALNRQHMLYCWGRLPWSATDTSATPVPAPTSEQFVTVSVGGYATCGVTSDHRAFCIGNALIGDGSTSQERRVGEVAGGYSWSMVSAGGAMICGITTGGVLYCWGENNNDELGSAGSTCGRQSCSITPALVDNGSAFSSIHSGQLHACAKKPDGELFCWGRDYEGQVGNGTYVLKVPSPRVVAGQHVWRW